MRTILILVFLAFYQFGNAQLIDPFEKVITHEIKLTKLKNGGYMGAMEWTTGGIDSLQRFVVNGLDVKSPAMVRIITKAPDHNIDLSFHKSGWDKVESKISTDGDKFADKVFRTMNTAGLGVYSDVAGIPYLIIVKVGLQFPSTNSLIRITDNQEEYNRHLRKMGLSGNIFVDENSNSSENYSSTATNVEEGNNMLMYIIIGLLAIIIVLLATFLIRKQKSKNTLVLLFAVGFCINVMAQSNEPKLIPIPGQGNSPVFYEYSTQNVVNQKTVPIDKPRIRDASVDASVGNSGVFRRDAHVRIESNPESRELSREEIDDLQRRMENADEEFDLNYRENMPGEETEGDQRTLPSDRSNEELNRLRRQVQQLQLQVQLLSQEDEQYEEQDYGGGEILLYCEDIRACQNCVRRGFNEFNKRRAYFDYLQKYYLKKVSDLNDWIEWGNSISSLPGGGGMAWGPIYMYKVKPAMEELNNAYNKKFDEYIESMETDLESIHDCYQGEHGSFRSREGYEAQIFAVLNALKASKIHK